MEEQATTVWAPDDAPVATNQLEKARQESQVAAAAVSAADYCYRRSSRHAEEVGAFGGELRGMVAHAPTLAESSGSRVRSA